MTARKRSATADDGTVRRTTTLTAEVAKKLEERAEKRDVSVSWLMARIIREFVESADED